MSGVGGEKAELRTPWQNARVVMPVAAAQCLAYFALNHWPPRASNALPLTFVDAWMPFWPWTVWPYLMMIGGQVVLPLLLRRPEVFARALIAYVCAMSAVFAVFALWPTHYLRGPLPPTDAWHGAVFELLCAVDTAECCFPSGHVVGPAVVCWALWRDRGARTAWCLALFPVITLSILTTKQHYFWDLLGGFGVAAAAVMASGPLARRALAARRAQTSASKRVRTASIDRACARHDCGP